MSPSYPTPQYTEYTHYQENLNCGNLYYRQDINEYDTYYCNNCNYCHDFNRNVSNINNILNNNENLNQYINPAEDNDFDEQQNDQIQQQIDNQQVQTEFEVNLLYNFYQNIRYNQYSSYIDDIMPELVEF